MCVLAGLARAAYGLTADLVHFQIKPAMQNDQSHDSPLSGIGRVFFNASFVDFLVDIFLTAYWHVRNKVQVEIVWPADAFQGFHAALSKK